MFGKEKSYRAGQEAGYKAGYSDGMLAGLEEALEILRGAMKRPGEATDTGRMKKGAKDIDEGRTEGHPEKAWKGKKKAGRRQGPV